MTWSDQSWVVQIYAVDGCIILLNSGLKLYTPPLIGISMLHMTSSDQIVKVVP